MADIKFSVFVHMFISLFNLSVKHLLVCYFFLKILIILILYVVFLPYYDNGKTTCYA